MTLLPDLQIARTASLKPLDDIAAAMGIGTHLLEAYGEHVAKIKLSAIGELANRPKAKYVVVSAVTPTPLGEGKTTTTVGLGQALCQIGRQAACSGSPPPPSTTPTRPSSVSRRPWPPTRPTCCGASTSSRSAHSRPPPRGRSTSATAGSKWTTATACG